MGSYFVTIQLVALNYFEIQPVETNTCKINYFPRQGVYTLNRIIKGSFKNFYNSNKLFRD